MAEIFGHLLSLVRTSRLRRPVVSATVCFVSVLKHTVIYFRLCAQHVCADRLIQLPFVSLQRSSRWATKPFTWTGMLGKISCRLIGREL